MNLPEVPQIPQPEGALTLALTHKFPRRGEKIRLRKVRVFPNPRLCKALLDRVTDRAHIIETGTESFRFKRTMEGRRKK